MIYFIEGWLWGLSLPSLFALVIVLKSAFSVSFENVSKEG